MNQFQARAGSSALSRSTTIGFGTSAANAISGTRRLVLTAFAAAFSAFATIAADPAAAQTYPEKGQPIRIIVPTGAASAVDLLARVYAKAMTEHAGLSVFVENKPGAEGAIGVQSFLNMPPDGYTILIASSSMLSLNPVMLPNLSYDPLKDLLPIAGISKAGLVMNLGVSTQFKSPKELVAAAKANPEKYTCANSTTTTRMACEVLQARAGIKLLLVPYKATANAMQAVAAGESDMIFVDAGTAVSLWATGKVRGVGVTTPERLSTLPKLPTMLEDGIADFNMTAWYAAYFKPGTPPAAVAAMRKTFNDVAARPEVQESLTRFSMDPLNLVGDDLAALNRREIAQWQKLVKDQNIKFTPN